MEPKKRTRTPKIKTDPSQEEQIGQILYVSEIIFLAVLQAVQTWLRKNNIENTNAIHEIKDLAELILKEQELLIQDAPIVTEHPDSTQ